MSKRTAPDQTAAITSDTGPFAIVPEWVIDGDVSDRALRLYAVLARYADHEGSSWPSRRRIAERLRCSVNSLDRARQELEEVGAVAIERRYTADGDPTTNRYTVRRVRPGTPTRGETVPPPVSLPGTPTSDAQNESQVVEREPLERDHRVVPPGTVNRKRVTAGEGELAQYVLRDWNVLTRQSLRSPDWLSKIIMRIREHPDLGIDEHVHIIRIALAHPWWKGDPSPSVIYGNGALFEQHLTQAAKGNAGGSQGAFQVALNAINEARRSA